MTARLVLLRHGRTAWNAAGRFQGQADPPLDPTGVVQTRRAAAAIGRLRPARVLSSDLRRARSAARAIADAMTDACGLPPAAVVVDPALREVALGAWEGLDHEEARRRFPDEYETWTAGLRGPKALTGDRNEDVRRGGGETGREAGARAAATLARALQECAPDETVVAVAHGLVLEAAMAELAARRVITLDGPAPHLGNGEWIELRASPTSGEPANL